jgi:uncharacterized protein YneF (UPF0154 family)
MKDRYKNTGDRQRIQRGRSLWRSPRLRKDELRTMAAEAFRNTAGIKVQQVQPNKAKR